MSASGRKRCVVAYATPRRQWLWEVDLANEATIAEALAVARTIAANDQVPWECTAVGIFGELRARDFVPLDGDRIEIYRPLAVDPRERRRQSARRARR